MFWLLVSFSTVIWGVTLADTGASLVDIDYMQLKLNTRKSLKPECKQAAAREEDLGWSGILALSGGGGGSSQGHKAFEVFYWSLFLFISSLTWECSFLDKHGLYEEGQTYPGTERCKNHSWYQHENALKDMPVWLCFACSKGPRVRFQQNYWAAGRNVETCLRWQINQILSNS